jgi:hypothetical protein
MAKGSRYSALVAEAERAVAAVTDPELKRAAFEKVLDDLLSRADNSGHRAKQQTSPKANQPGPKPQRPRGGPLAYLGELIDDGFFKKPKTITQVKAELENRGHHIPLTSLSGPLMKFCQRRTLRRHRVKGSKGTKPTFNYSNW